MADSLLVDLIRAQMKHQRAMTVALGGQLAAECLAVFL
jgi:hypothetical protein